MHYALPKRQAQQRKIMSKLDALYDKLSEREFLTSHSNDMSATSHLKYLQIHSNYNCTILAMVKTMSW